MYQIGDKVVYGVEGACIVAAIEEKDYISGPQQYYRLEPIASHRSTIYVPVENGGKCHLRNIMSRTALDEKIQKALAEPISWINDNKRRQQWAQETIKSEDTVQILQMIQVMMRFHRDKGLNGRDKDALQRAQRLVFSEVAMVYDKGFEETGKDMQEVLCH